MDDNVIETNNLTVLYGKHRGIDGVSLTVKQGEVFGFLGPNGAGKTTTLRVLLDIIRPNQGTASIFGLDCQKDGVAIRNRIGYIPGELALPLNMKGRVYLNTIDALRNKKANPDYRRKLAARFDLDISRRIRDYSRGNKQKLALIAACMHKPDLLILDEPTGGLDPLVQQTVLETVREAQDEGRTVFFSSHILPEVQAVCDRIGIIRYGKIVAIESVKELLERTIHRLRLQFNERLHDNALKMDGVVVVERSDYHAVVEVSKDLGQFLYKAAQFNIIDIETKDVSLEEVFLTYYSD